MNIDDMSGDVDWEEYVGWQEDCSSRGKGKRDDGVRGGGEMADAAVGTHRAIELIEAAIAETSRTREEVDATILDQTPKVVTKKLVFLQQRPARAAGLDLVQVDEEVEEEEDSQQGMVEEEGVLDETALGQSREELQEPQQRADNLSKLEARDEAAALEGATSWKSYRPFKSDNARIVARRPEAPAPVRAVLLSPRQAAHLAYDSKSLALEGIQELPSFSTAPGQRVDSNQELVERSRPRKKRTPPPSLRPAQELDAYRPSPGFWEKHHDAAAQEEANKRLKAAAKARLKDSQQFFLGATKDSMSSRIAAFYSPFRLLGRSAKHVPSFRPLKRRRKRIPQRQAQVKQSMDESRGVIPQRKLFGVPLRSQEKRVLLLHNYDVGPGVCGHEARTNQESHPCTLADAAWVSDDHSGCSGRRNGVTPGFLLTYSVKHDMAVEVPCSVISFDATTKMYRIALLMAPHKIPQGGLGKDTATVQKKCPRTILRFEREPVVCFYARMRMADKLRELAGSIWRWEEFQRHQRKVLGRFSLDKRVAGVQKDHVCTSGLWDMRERIVSRSLEFSTLTLSQRPAEVRKADEEPQSVLDPQPALPRNPSLASLSNRFREIRSLLGPLCDETVEAGTGEARSFSSDNDSAREAVRGLVDTIFTKLVTAQQEQGGSAADETTVVGTELQRYSLSRTLQSTHEMLAHELTHVVDEHMAAAASRYFLLQCSKSSRELERCRRRIMRPWRSVPSWMHPKRIQLYNFNLPEWDLGNVLAAKLEREKCWERRNHIMAIHARSLPFKSMKEQVQDVFFATFPRLRLVITTMHDYGADLHGFLSNEFVKEATDCKTNESPAKRQGHVKKQIGLFLDLEEDFAPPLRVESFTKMQALHLQTVVHLLSSKWVHGVTMLFLGKLNKTPGPGREDFNFFTNDLAAFDQSCTAKLITRSLLLMRQNLLDFVSLSLERYIGVFEDRAGCFTKFCNVKQSNGRQGDVLFEKRITERSGQRGFFTIHLHYSTGADFSPALEDVRQTVLSTLANVGSALVDLIEDPTGEWTPVLKALMVVAAGESTERDRFKPFLDIDQTKTMTVRRRKVSDNRYSFFRTIHQNHDDPLADFSNALWNSKCRLDVIISEAVSMAQSVIDRIHAFELEILGSINAPISHIASLNLRVYTAWFARPLVKRFAGSERDDTGDVSMFMSLRFGGTGGFGAAGHAGGSDCSDSGDSLFGTGPEDDSLMFQGLDLSESDSEGDERADASLLRSKSTIKRTRERRRRQSLVDADFVLTGAESFPASEEELERSYRESSSIDAEASMLTRCHAEVTRLRGLIFKIEEEIPTDVRVPLFEVESRQAKNNLMEACKRLVDTLLNELVAQSLVFLARAQDKYQELEEKLKRPIQSAEDLRRLWDLEEDMHENLLEEIQRTLVDRALHRFDVLDSVYFLRSSNVVAHEMKVKLAPARLAKLCTESLDNAQSKSGLFLTNTNREKESLRGRFQQLKHRFEAVRDSDEINNCVAISAEAEHLQDNLATTLEEIEAIVQKIRVFDRPRRGDPSHRLGKVRPSASSLDADALCREVKKVNHEFQFYTQLWTVVADATEALDLWKRGVFMDINPAQVEAALHGDTGWVGTTSSLLKHFSPDDDAKAFGVCIKLRTMLEEFELNLPLINLLRSDALKPRHWHQIIDLMVPMDGKVLASLLGLNREQWLADKRQVIPSASGLPALLPSTGMPSMRAEEEINRGLLSLGKLQELRVAHYIDEVSQICFIAEREYQNEQTLTEQQCRLESHQVMCNTAGGVQHIVLTPGLLGEASSTETSSQDPPASVTNAELDAVATEPRAQHLSSREQASTVDAPCLAHASSPESATTPLDLLSLEQIVDEQLVVARRIERSVFSKQGGILRKAERWGSMLDALGQWTRAVGTFQRLWTPLERVFGRGGEAIVALGDKEIQSFRFADVVWKKMTKTLQDSRVSVLLIAKTLAGHGAARVAELDPDYRILPVQVMNDLVECMEVVSRELAVKLRSYRDKCPSLFLLSDSQLIKFISDNHFDSSRLYETIPFVVGDLKHLELDWAPIPPGSERFLNAKSQFKNEIALLGDDGDVAGFDAQQITAVGPSATDTANRVQLSEGNTVDVALRINLKGEASPSVDFLRKSVAVVDWVPRLEECIRKQINADTHAVFRQISSGEFNMVAGLKVLGQQVLLVAHSLIWTGKLDVAFQECLHGEVVRAVLSSYSTSHFAKASLVQETLPQQSDSNDVKRHAEPQQNTVQTLRGEVDALTKLVIGTLHSMRLQRQHLHIVTSAEALLAMLSQLEEILLRSDSFFWHLNFRYYTTTNGKGATGIELRTAGDLSLGYQFNFQGSLQRLVLEPQTLRVLRAMVLSARTVHAGVLIGEVGSGKNLLVRELATMAGARLVGFNSAWLEPANGVPSTDLLEGVVQSHVWAAFELMDARSWAALVTWVPQLLNSLRVRQGMEGAAVFLTTNASFSASAQGNGVISGVPEATRALMRVISIAPPDLVPILLCLFRTAFDVDRSVALSVALSTVNVFATLDRLAPQNGIMNLRVIQEVLQDALNRSEQLKASTAANRVTGRANLLNQGLKVSSSASNINMVVSQASFAVLVRRLGMRHWPIIKAIVQSVFGDINDSKVKEILLRKQEFGDDMKRASNQRESVLRSIRRHSLSSLKLRRRRLGIDRSTVTSQQDTSVSGRMLARAPKRSTLEGVNHGPTSSSGESATTKFISTLLTHALTNRGKKAYESGLLPACHEFLEALGLHPSVDHESAFSKTWSRGLVVVGPPRSGKSTLMAVVMEAIRLVKETQKHRGNVIRIFPGALSLAELLGGCTEAGVWADGLLITAVKQVAAERVEMDEWVSFGDVQGHFHKQHLSDKFLGGADFRDFAAQVAAAANHVSFVVLDGDVRAEWMSLGFEALVQDSHRFLVTRCPSADVVDLQGAGTPRVVLETTSLENLSPGALAKSTIVHIGSETVGWQELIFAWLACTPPESVRFGVSHPKYLAEALRPWKKYLELLVGRFFAPVLELFIPVGARLGKTAEFVLLANALLEENQQEILDSEDPEYGLEGAVVQAVTWTIGVVQTSTWINPGKSAESGQSGKRSELSATFEGAFRALLCAHEEDQSESRKGSHLVRTFLMEQSRILTIKTLLPSNRMVIDFVFDFSAMEWKTWEDWSEALGPAEDGGPLAVQREEHSEGLSSQWISLRNHGTLFLPSATDHRNVYILGTLIRNGRDVDCLGSGSPLLVGKTIELLERFHNTVLGASFLSVQASLASRDATFQASVLHVLERQYGQVYAPPAIADESVVLRNHADVGSSSTFPDRCVAWVTDVSMDGPAADQLRQFAETGSFYGSAADHLKVARARAITLQGTSLVLFGSPRLSHTRLGRAVESKVPLASVMEGSKQMMFFRRLLRSRFQASPDLFGLCGQVLLPLSDELCRLVQTVREKDCDGSRMLHRIVYALRCTSNHYDSDPKELASKVLEIWLNQVWTVSVNVSADANWASSTILRRVHESIPQIAKRCSNAAAIVHRTTMLYDVNHVVEARKTGVPSQRRGEQEGDSDSDDGVVEEVELAPKHHSGPMKAKVELGQASVVQLDMSEPRRPCVMGTMAADNSIADLRFIGGIWVADSVSRLSREIAFSREIGLSNSSSRRGLVACCDLDNTQLGPFVASELARKHSMESIFLLPEASRTAWLNTLRKVLFDAVVESMGLSHKRKQVLLIVDADQLRACAHDPGDPSFSGETILMDLRSLAETADLPALWNWSQPKSEMVSSAEIQWQEDLVKHFATMKLKQSTNRATNQFVVSLASGNLGSRRSRPANASCKVRSEMSLACDDDAARVSDLVRAIQEQPNQRSAFLAEFALAVKERVQIVVLEAGTDGSLMQMPNRIPLLPRASQGILVDLVKGVLKSACCGDSGKEKLLPLFPGNESQRTRMNEGLLEFAQLVLEMHEIVMHVLELQEGAQCPSKETSEDLAATVLRFAWVAARKVTTRRAALQREMRQVEQALMMVDVANLLVKSFQQEVEALNPTLAEAMRAVEKTSAEVDLLNSKNEHQHSQLQEQAAEWTRLSADVDRLRGEIEEAIEDVTPRLSLASEALGKVQRARLAELRSQRNPSSHMATVMQAVYMVYKNEPAEVREELCIEAKQDLMEQLSAANLASGELEERLAAVETQFSVKEFYWSRVTSPDILGDSRIVSKLLGLKKDGIDEVVLGQVQNMLASLTDKNQNAEINGGGEGKSLAQQEDELGRAKSVTVVHKSPGATSPKTRTSMRATFKDRKPKISSAVPSVAAQQKALVQPFMDWLSAICSFREVLDTIEPKQEEVKRLVSDLSLVDTTRKGLMRDLGVKSQLLVNARSQYEEDLAKLRLLQEQVECASGKANRASQIASALEGQVRRRWKEQLALLRSKDEDDTADGTVGADALVVSACQVYFGRLQPSARSVCLGAWMELLLDSGLKPSLATGFEHVSWNSAFAMKNSGGANATASLQSVVSDGDPPRKTSLPGLLGRADIQLGDSMEFTFPLGETLETDQSARVCAAWIDAGLPLNHDLIVQALMIAETLRDNAECFAQYAPPIPAFVIQVPLLTDPDGFGFAWLRKYRAGNGVFATVSAAATQAEVQTCLEQIAGNESTLAVVGFDGNVSTAVCRLILGYSRRFSTRDGNGKDFVLVLLRTRLKSSDAHRQLGHSVATFNFCASESADMASMVALQRMLKTVLLEQDDVAQAVVRVGAAFEGELERLSQTSFDFEKELSGLLLNCWPVAQCVGRLACSLGAFSKQRDLSPLKLALFDQGIAKHFETFWTALASSETGNIAWSVLFEKMVGIAESAENVLESSVSAADLVTLGAICRLEVEFSRRVFVAMQEYRAFDRLTAWRLFAENGAPQLSNGGARSTAKLGPFSRNPSGLRPRGVGGNMKRLQARLDLLRGQSRVTMVGQVESHVLSKLDVHARGNFGLDPFVERKLYGQHARLSLMDWRRILDSCFKLGQHEQQDLLDLDVILQRQVPVKALSLRLAQDPDQFLRRELERLECEDKFDSFERFVILASAVPTRLSETLRNFVHQHALEVKRMIMDAQISRKEGRPGGGHRKARLDARRGRKVSKANLNSRKSSAGPIFSPNPQVVSCKGLVEALRTFRAATPIIVKGGNLTNPAKATEVLRTLCLKEDPQAQFRFVPSPSLQTSWSEVAHSSRIDGRPIWLVVGDIATGRQFAIQQLKSTLEEHRVLERGRGAGEETPGTGKDDSSDTCLGAAVEPGVFLFLVAENDNETSKLREIAPHAWEVELKDGNQEEYNLGGRFKRLVSAWDNHPLNRGNSDAIWKTVATAVIFYFAVEWQLALHQRVERPCMKKVDVDVLLRDLASHSLLVLQERFARSADATVVSRFLDHNGGARVEYSDGKDGAHQAHKLSMLLDFANLREFWEEFHTLEQIDFCSILSLDAVAQVVTDVMSVAATHHIYRGSAAAVAKSRARLHYILESAEVCVPLTEQAHLEISLRVGHCAPEYTFVVQSVNYAERVTLFRGFDEPSDEARTDWFKTCGLDPKADSRFQARETARLRGVLSICFGLEHGKAPGASEPPAGVASGPLEVPTIEDGEALTCESRDALMDRVIRLEIRALNCSLKNSTGRSSNEKWRSSLDKVAQALISRQPLCDVALWMPGLREPRAVLWACLVHHQITGGFESLPACGLRCTFVRLNASPLLCISGLVLKGCKWNDALEQVEWQDLEGAPVRAPEIFVYDKATVDAAMLRNRMTLPFDPFLLQLHHRGDQVSPTAGGYYTILERAARARGAQRFCWEIWAALESR
ncbi:Dynein axonemal heavy chain 3 (Axonemal beta dynein heavy chain 3) (Ciliary dynein heavy chain 3) [Durusdinium trenchii]|uniref:Dynein axonemal heavy chain 3 (Axonemal beta dynein heavy chain 3) (Ciliary dynein heavy chain 3) n=1 Tax=Durusdinium trenchii TaxID=1381693 RepID=A0ABP0PXM5_9DINO